MPATKLNRQNAGRHQSEAKSAIFARVVADGVRCHGYPFPNLGIGDLVQVEDGS